MMSKTTLSERFAKTALVRSVVARNIAANFIVIGWLSLLSILAIPVYIKLLGVSEWGIVAACASLQLLFNFIDAGFSQIVPKWVAREANDKVSLRNYVTLFRKVYLGLSILMLAFLQLNAEYLAHSWFQVAPDQSEKLELAIRIIAFQMLFQFVNNLHIGLWHGMQRQVLASLSVGGFGTLKHVATMSVLYFGTADALSYASTFAVAAMLEVVTNAWLVRRMLGSSGKNQSLNLIKLKPFLMEVSVLSGGIVVGLMVSQLDRFILSRTVPLEDFGVYTVVATLALAFLQLQAPITRAYFPLLVQDIQNMGRVSSIRMKRLVRGSLILSTLPALLACLFAAPLLSFWLQDSRFVEVGQRPMQLLLLAVAVNTVYGCIYQVMIASGSSHLVLKFNLVAFAVAGVVATTVTASDSSTGILLGGFIWLAATLTQLLLGLIWFIFYESQRHTPNKEQ